ncbi:MAG: hypothetical protein AB1461_02630 [Thermodesulfobacteriota bacterium]
MELYRGKILWVDDDKFALTPFYDELRDNEYDVEMVGSADKAIEILSQRASEFDLAILDIMLPSGKRLSPLATKGQRDGVDLIT